MTEREVIRQHGIAEKLTKALNHKRENGDLLSVREVEDALVVSKVRATAHQRGWDDGYVAACHDVHVKGSTAHALYQLRKDNVGAVPGFALKD